eukprot:34764-Pelagomonas_calceolata.AAC.6
MAQGEWAAADKAYAAALEHAGSEDDSADAAECMDGRWVLAVIELLLLRWATLPYRMHGWQVGSGWH